MRARLLQVIGDQRLRDQMFVVDWNFCNARGNLISTSFDEIADDLLLEEAYPSLGKSVSEFIDGYLNARETVLILQGPPGTGKTRLVRAILAAMSRRKGESAKIMYTADKRALENDEIFVDFITGSHDAFVIEDADHLLKARTSGNFELHRFLGIADGVVRAQSRKVIFTTNLPNINDIDDALLRPGRCHAVKNLRNLEPAEALRLAEKICGADAEAAARVCAKLSAMAARAYSVAQVYRACA
jgi:SpoVK/Ycf46/Vps4 family AAA+-type ATPase